MSDNYPSRQQFFANRFIRLLGKTCVAQEIGCTGFALLVTIVMTEDASRYRRAVTFYDGQLMPILGMDSKKTLATARQKAIEAGWLHYQHGSKGRPGRYWVLIPEHANGIEDTPIDDGEDESNQMRTKCGVNFTQKEESNRERIGEETGENRERIGHPFLPTPIPTPIPKYIHVADAPACCDSAEKPDEILKVNPSDLQAEWNRCLGLVPIKSMSQKRKVALKARSRDAVFVEKWRECIVAIANSDFCCGGGERGWRADVDWFLRPDTYLKILEGKFANERTGATNGKRTDSHLADDGGATDRLLAKLFPD